MELVKAEMGWDVVNMMEWRWKGGGGGSKTGWVVSMYIDMGAHAGQE